MWCKLRSRSVMTAKSECPVRWWVMTHFRMSQFKEWLVAENVRRLGEGGVLLEPFYPSDFLESGDEGQGLSSARGDGRLSADFSHFVFIKASGADIADLVWREKELGHRYVLLHYLDTDGRRAVVHDAMMKAFFDACLKYRGYFEVVPPMLGLEARDRVRIKSGPFAGQQASVVSVRRRNGGVQLDLELELVNGLVSVRMSDVDKGQVALVGRSVVDAIRADFIEYTQLHLLEILEHRVKGVADKDVRRRDVAMLMRLYSYRDQPVENAAARTHFLALMLICAHLCRYKADEQELTAKAMASLEEIDRRRPSKAATDTRAYLWIALYVVTRNPVYRQYVKQYIRDFQPKSERLRRFVTLIRTGKRL